MKLLGEGGRPYELLWPGVEKSSISLLNKIPVLLPLTLAPILKKPGHCIMLYITEASLTNTCNRHLAIKHFQTKEANHWS